MSLPSATVFDLPESSALPNHNTYHSQSRAFDRTGQFKCFFKFADTLAILFSPTIIREMPIDFLFSAKSAIFLKPRAANPLSKSVVEAFVRAAADSKSGSYVERTIRQARIVDGISVRFTYACFRIATEPAFLHGSELRDLKYAFLLLVEAPNVVAILSRNVQGLAETLASHCERWDYKDLGGVFAEERQAYERLSLRGMSLARNTVRRRNMEAEDLTESLALSGIHRSMPSSFRTRGPAGVHSIAPSVGRISRKDPRGKIDDLLRWVLQTGSALSTAATNYPDTFLAQFCRAIPFEELPHDAQPNAILFDFSRLRREWEEAPTAYEFALAQSPRADRARIMSEESIVALFEMAREVLLIEGDTIVYESPKHKRHAIGSIRINKRTLSVRSHFLDRVRIRTPTGETTLGAYANSEDCYMVTFSRPEFGYSDRQLFEDSELLGSVDKLLQLFEPRAELSIITEEKDVTGTRFGANGLFHFVENSLLPSAAVLVCDDLGDEWADYISVEQESGIPTLSFIHCKHGKVSSGASAMQEPVGQAIKNLSRMHRSFDAFAEKVRGPWSANYSDTEIARIRRGGTMAEIEDQFSSAIGSARLDRIVILVLSGLSLAQITDEFELLELGIARPHISQLLWILTSFWSACREHGVQARIICRP